MKVLPGGRATSLLVLAIVPSLGGCARLGAPSFVLFGSYFPGWMLCGCFGIVAAIVGRAALIATRLADFLPYQLFVCTAIGTIFAAGAWLVWFGQ